MLACFGHKQRGMCRGSAYPFTLVKQDAKLEMHVGSCTAWSTVGKSDSIKFACLRPKFLFSSGTVQTI